MQTLLLRHEVPVNLTWDLSDIYPNADALYQDVERLEEKTTALSTRDISLLEEVLILRDHLANYAELLLSTDHGNEENARTVVKIEKTLAKTLPALESTLHALGDLPEEELRRLSEDPARSAFWKKLMKDRPHRLGKEAEELLAGLDEVLNNQEKLYGAWKFSDLSFPPLTVEGKDYAFSFPLFENLYEYEEDTTLRRAAFSHFSTHLRRYEEVAGENFLAMVKRDVALSRARHYDDVFSYLLRDQDVDRATYDAHLDLLAEEMPKVMLPFVKKNQEDYGLPELTYADLKLPPKVNLPAVPLEEARPLLEKAFAPLGEDVVQIVHDGLTKRWIDFPENEGKSTGGFCASPYGIHSYILTTWHDLVSDLFTLAHELGHAVHFSLADRENSILTHECSLAFVESPSTTSELLMTASLMENATEEEKKDLASLSLANTYYHNCVTHLLEALFQREVYRRAEAGDALTPKDLSAIFKSCLEDFWGDEVLLDEGAELTWMRQPHYYEGLYSYTYSMGLAIGTVLANRLPKEPELAKTWREILVAGGSDTPSAYAAHLGLDLKHCDHTKAMIASLHEMVATVLS